MSPYYLATITYCRNLTITKVRFITNPSRFLSNTNLHINHRNMDIFLREQQNNLRCRSRNLRALSTQDYSTEHSRSKKGRVQSGTLISGQRKCIITSCRIVCLANAIEIRNAPPIDSCRVALLPPMVLAFAVQEQRPITHGGRPAWRR